MCNYTVVDNCSGTIVGWLAKLKYPLQTTIMVHASSLVPVAFSPSGARVSCQLPLRQFEGEKSNTAAGTPDLFLNRLLKSGHLS